MGKLIDKDTDFLIDMKDVCSKCIKKASCKELCYPIKCYMSHGDKVNFQETVRTESDGTITEKWADDHRIVHGSAFTVKDDDGEDYDFVENSGYLSDKSGYATSFFSELVDDIDSDSLPPNKQQLLLYLRHGCNVDAVSTALGGIDKDIIHSNIYHLRQNLKDALRLVINKTGHVMKVVRNKTATRDEKAYILSDFFQFSDDDIAEVLGISRASVTGGLQRTRRRIIMGEPLFQISDDKREETKRQMENDRVLNMESARRKREREKQAVAATA